MRKGVRNPEDIAGHMYRMALMSFCFTSEQNVKSNVDREKLDMKHTTYPLTQEISQFIIVGICLYKFYLRRILRIALIVYI